MALLGLGKKSEDKPKEEVPEELPDLPDDLSSDENTPGEAPDELPPAELAPDELPPVGEISQPIGSRPSVDDQRLYFSSMLQKMHDEGISATKLMVPSANLISDMKKHWKKQRKEMQIDEMMQKVQDSITPLQRLEQEWVALHDEIEDKRQQLREKEDAIRKLAEEARSVALKAQKMSPKGK